jgi:aldehyde dehydrogenase (NAD+)
LTIFADALLQEELFGPILPVIRADYVTAYKHINKREHPLALYIFSSKQSEIDESKCTTL